MNLYLTEFLSLIHFMAVGSIALYGAHRLWLLINWFLINTGDTDSCLQPEYTHYPHVTVQLPFYNEKYVAAQLIETVSRLDWPLDKLEIQVLDDSDDETSDIINQTSTRMAASGINISVVKRKDRVGYKAGALENGLHHATGKFIAVFDADFQPDEDFLKKTVHFFSDSNVGMVQAKWSFTNAEHSWLTKIQSILLGPHFDIEHRIRFNKGHFFNFNGTAGIWRKDAVTSAGGWQHDTVTEDLDLSYRAQIKGWRFIYLHNYSVRSELPVSVSSFRRQQQRWAKGAIQTARKILPLLLRSELPVSTKIEAMFHLLSNLGWLSGTIATLTLYPALKWRFSISYNLVPWFDLPLFFLAAFAIPVYFLAHLKQTGHRSALSCAAIIPVFTIGFAPGPALAVFMGLFKNGGKFERTPKYGTDPGTIITKSYNRKSMPYLFVTAVLMILSTAPLSLAIGHKVWLAVPLTIIFPVGFALILAEEFKELRQK